MRKSLIGAIAAFALLLGGGAVACKPSSSTSPVAEKPVVVAVQQVPSAKIIAAKYHGEWISGYKIVTPDMFGQIDHGDFRVGNKYYSVEVFSTADGMAKWMAFQKEGGYGKLTGHPKWQGPTWLAYQTVDISEIMGGK